ncbi:Csu type fimbrial protein [Microbulbifer thermotolerans]|uniref:Spore coat U domain-containing protein n=1 Tax=Microbulbifer thermotolerans TaxID=252514 RepID=A0A143HPW0_MICTH|nr:spore coat U domain-containing protein [Microbulbifer thermotolerans]AMX03763.1 hypothetical protein A3224_15255 [Microbulbifer thermotolerans]MCX2780705.1 spore coat U domain-containing protein [Microbulbifer thermotolerans]MCX2783569.1 spore coat U domain-containing protein [Microbulbifer thermotolerans]MCX2795780.1 spore coat U domain-containing protein [Microbulbifer thermotolerans]MCX2801944.1 spore coat U domain-containing protein [Microbulbifer thermotolerans]
MAQRILLVFTMLLTGVSWGQDCTYTVTPTLNFGSVTGLPTPQIDATADITVQCPVLDLLQRRICISLPVGSGGVSLADRRLTSGAFDVPFNVYRDAARTQVWGTVASGQQVQLDFPVLFGGTMTATVYGRVFAGGGSAAGFYQSVFNTIEVREGTYAVLAPNCSSLTPFNLAESMTAQLQVEPDCTISASPLDFGTVTNLVQTDASSNLSVTCTLNGAYSVALDGGGSGDINNRRMLLGGDSIDYQLYQDAARTQVWGDTVGTVVSGTGSGAAQSITVYGRVPAQGAKPPGIYQDTITATVTF